jgi:hypothetical protein
MLFAPALYNALTLGQNRAMLNKRLSAGRGESLLQELKGVITQLGIRVREEKLLREVGYRVRGGGCRVRGQEVVFLDRERPISERIDTLLDELAGKNLKDVSLSPPLRRLLVRKEAT